MPRSAAGSTTSSGAAYRALSSYQSAPSSDSTAFASACTAGQTNHRSRTIGGLGCGPVRITVPTDASSSRRLRLLGGVLADRWPAPRLRRSGGRLLVQRLDLRDAPATHHPGLPARDRNDRHRLVQAIHQERALARVDWVVDDGVA